MVFFSAISGPNARFGIAVVAPGWSLGWLRIADPLHKPLFLSVDLIKMHVVRSLV